MISGLHMKQVSVPRHEHTPPLQNQFITSKAQVCNITITHLFHFLCIYKRQLESQLETWSPP